MRYISLFSGIESASAAWEPMGWAPVCFSEIEPFPRAVLSHRFPDVPLHGDMTGVDWHQYRNQADVVVAGAPCQAFSVAGARQSLDDDRGNLTLRTIEAINAIHPEYIVFENVPGILSTKDNAFGCFLAGLVGADAPLQPPGRCRWSDAGLVSGPDRRVAWRILDAQFFGVPQRRRRVFVVGCPRNGADPAEILFEPKSLHRHPAPSRKAREETAADAIPSVASTLGATEWATDTERMTFLPITTGTVSSKWSKGSGGSAGDEVQNMVAIEACYDMRGNGDGKTCNTLTGDHANRPTDYTPVVCVNAREDPISISGKDLPLGAKDIGHGIVPLDLRKVQRDPEKKSGLGIGKTGEPVYALCAGREVNGIINNLDVRRLTPTECERLQGFPDGWTQVPYRNKPAADGPRYKALGNAMAVPVMRWIGEQIGAQ